jgi:hypothetical protein
MDTDITVPVEEMSKVLGGNVYRRMDMEAC